jgi:hypothetical protein
MGTYDSKMIKKKEREEKGKSHHANPIAPRTNLRTCS